ncbi:uncharacterized protein LOC134572961 [Pelobates fuscus]|uniref:uncharacterized protein LOC134572961 n=1 Tax=Pelobates fuscus TaxID=191477 RepID=UPI002FE481A9
MLTDVSGNNIKGLDGFYNELRRKYPNTFNLATDLGKGDKAIQRLPQLDNAGSHTSVGVPPKFPNPLPPQRWSPDSFLYKVQSQKTKFGQRQEEETSHSNGLSVIIQDKTVSVPSWRRRDYVGIHSQGSFRLPSLRSQVEQNKVELKSRLNTTKSENEPKSDHQSTSSRLNGIAKAESSVSTKNISDKDILQSQPRPSPVKSDPLGTIMKELLPNKPGRIINDQPRTNRNTYHNNVGSMSDSDSGKSACAPLKIFRPKSRSPHGPPASSDIIKKFSAKPKSTHGPVRANHGVTSETQVLTAKCVKEMEPGNILEKIYLGESRKSESVRSKENIQPKLAAPRVRFEDESEQEAETRYKERCLLEKKEPSRNEMKDVESYPMYVQERVKKADFSQITSRSPQYEKQQIMGNQTVNVPYRRQPFPPSVAKKVLIDIPTSGHPIKRSLRVEVSPPGKSMMDKPMSPRSHKETASLEGITMCFSSTDGQWKGQEEMVYRKSIEENRIHRSTSSMETIESGITEVSLESNKKRMEWGGSGSSISSGMPELSSVENHDTKLVHQARGVHLSKNLQKGAGEMSFYSKMKKSLHVRMRLNSDTKKLSGSSQSEGSDFLELGSQHSSLLESDLELHHSSKDSRASRFTPTSPVLMKEKMPDNTTKQKKKMEITSRAGTESADPPSPAKTVTYNFSELPAPGQTPTHHPEMRDNKVVGYWRE